MPRSERLQALLDAWREDDPEFDVEALVSEAEAMESPSLQDLEILVGDLARRWETGPDGSKTLVFDREAAEHAATRLEALAPSSLPVLLLGLRSPEDGVQESIAGVLSRVASPQATGALMSVLEKPSANLARHLGGRPQHFPVDALVKLGSPGIETRVRLETLLGASDFRSAEAAAKVLAEFAGEEGVVDALLRFEHRAAEEDGFAWALMRAAEVSRDPRLSSVLEMMQGAPKRFPGGFFKKRIKEVLENLKG